MPDGDCAKAGGRPQHRRQIPSQFDSQLALVRCQDDRVDEATKRLRGFSAGFWMLQRLSQCGDLLTVQVGHSRVQERRRFVCRCEFGFQFLALAAFAFNSSLTSLAGTPSIRRRPT